LGEKSGRSPATRGAWKGPLILDYEDSWVWKDSKDSGFTVKSTYDILRGPFEGVSLFVSL